MKYEAYYVICAKSQLIESLDGIGDIQTLLAEPSLWINMQGGREADPGSGYVQAVKCLFVAHVRQLMRRSGHTRHVLATLAPGEETFDEWWSMKVFDGWDEHAADVLVELEVEGALDDINPQVASNWAHYIKPRNADNR